MRRPQRHVKAQNSSAEESMISQQEITEAEIFKVTSFFYSTFFFSTSNRIDKYKLRTPTPAAARYASTNLIKDFDDVTLIRPPITGEQSGRINGRVFTDVTDVLLTFLCSRVFVTMAPERKWRLTSFAMAERCPKVAIRIVWSRHFDCTAASYFKIQLKLS